MIKKIANGATFIGVGDFNLTPDKDPIKLILKDGSILDARKVSETPPYGPRFTWHGNALKPKMSERIDYIFVSPDIKVSSFGVLTDLLSESSEDFSENKHPKNPEIRHPSDHYPVEAKIRF